MKSIYLLAEASSLFMRAEIVEESGQRWSYGLDSEHPAEWLAEQMADNQSVETQIVLVVPEEALYRRVVVLPNASREVQQDAIVCSWLTTELKESVGAFQWQRLNADAKGKAILSVQGIGARWLRDRFGVIGVQADHVQLISEGAYRLAQSNISEDGYVQLSNSMNPTVLAVIDQHIIDGRCSQTETEQTLMAQMQQAHTRLGLEHKMTSHLIMAYEDNQGKPFPTEALLKRPDGTRAKQRRPVLAILMLFCVVLPLAVMGFSRLQLNQQEALVTVETESSSIGVMRSHYSDLMTLASEVQTERVTVVKLEATQSSLFISGNCPSALDLADYLKRLDEADGASTALLTELNRKTEKKESHYEFVIQLSEGGTLE